MSYVLRCEVVVGVVGAAAVEPVRCPSPASAPGRCGATASAWSQRGSITAEFAVALPAVVLVLLLCLNALSLLGTQVRLVDAAGQSARLAARQAAVAEVQAAAQILAPGSSLKLAQHDGMHCAVLSEQRTVLGVPVLLRAEQCALLGGQ